MPAMILRNVNVVFASEGMLHSMTAKLVSLSEFPASTENKAYHAALLIEGLAGHIDQLRAIERLFTKKNYRSKERTPDLAVEFNKGRLLVLPCPFLIEPGQQIDHKRKGDRFTCLQQIWFRSNVESITTQGSYEDHVQSRENS